MTDAPPTPDRLKLELKDQLLWLCSIFGQPSDLLRHLAIAEWRRLRTWVRGVEALAAKLVRALATTIGPGTMPASPARRSSSTVPAERVAPDTDYPDSGRWIGVSFRFRDEASTRAPSQTSASASAFGWARGAILPEQADAPRGFRSARRLALRLEAVIRVAENAPRYAKRLSERRAGRRARPARRARPVQPRRAAPSREARITPLGPPLRPPAIDTG